MPHRERYPNVTGPPQTSELPWVWPPGHPIPEYARPTYGMEGSPSEFESVPFPLVRSIDFEHLMDQLRGLFGGGDTLENFMPGGGEPLTGTKGLEEWFSRRNLLKDATWDPTTIEEVMSQLEGGAQLLTEEQMESLVPPERPFGSQLIHPRWGGIPTVRGVRPLEKSRSVRRTPEEKAMLGVSDLVFGESSVPINDPRITGDRSARTYTYLPSMFNKNFLDKKLIVEKVLPTIKIHPKTGDRYWYDEDANAMKKLEFFNSEQEAEQAGQERDHSISTYWEYLQGRHEREATWEGKLSNKLRQFIPDTLEGILMQPNLERFREMDPSRNVWDETLLQDRLPTRDTIPVDTTMEDIMDLLKSGHQLTGEPPYTR